MASMPPDHLALAEAVRAACLRAALDAFEDASRSGLCCTGAWECAVGALRALDVAALDVAALLEARAPSGEDPGAALPASHLPSSPSEPGRRALDARNDGT